MRTKTAGAEPANALLQSVDDDAAVVTVMLGDTCSVVRVQRQAGAAQLQLTQAASGGPELLRQCKAQGWFDGAQVVLVLGSGERHFLTLDRPEVPPEELALAARYPLAEAMEVEAENLLATATPMPLINDALRPQMLAVAAQLDPVRARLAQLAGAGVRVRNIDIVDSALRGMVLLQGQAQQPGQQQGQSQTQGQPGQAQAEDGCVALASVGADICIGLIWQYQFCALRALALPPTAGRSARDDSDFQEQLALQIQRTADHYERQATRLAVRSVLASLPALSEEAQRTVLGALPLSARSFELSQALQLAPDAAQACAGNSDLTALACVAAARLLEPLAQQAAQRALALEQAQREALDANGYEPLGLLPLGSAASGALPTPAALSRAAIGQAAQGGTAGSAAGSAGGVGYTNTAAQRVDPPMALEDRP